MKKTVFTDFFFSLKNAGVSVSPTAFLRLHQAMHMGLVKSLTDFYMAARTILVKSERYFDLFDQVFAHCFQGAALPDASGVELDDLMRGLLAEWLANPGSLADTLGLDEAEVAAMTPEALMQYFLDRLKEQEGRHDGGSRWIGTAGTAPVGHSGFHPGGMRVGGISRNQSAIKVAMDRRYKDYSLQGPLNQAMVGEALKRLRRLMPVGPEDRVDIDATIRQTMKNGGEIEILFKKALKDKLRVVLAIDNGGWSMDPYISVVQTIFNYARNQFKDLKTYYFHNTIYDVLWRDPARYKKVHRVSDLVRQDPDTRLIIIGDASMAPYELMVSEGAIMVEARSGRASLEQLKLLAGTFKHSLWLNPVPKHLWHRTDTIELIKDIFPMFELTIDGLEKAVAHLMAK